MAGRGGASCVRCTGRVQLLDAIWRLLYTLSTIAPDGLSGGHSTLYIPNPEQGRSGVPKTLYEKSRKNFDNRIDNCTQNQIKIGRKNTHPSTFGKRMFRVNKQNSSEKGKYIGHTEKCEGIRHTRCVCRTFFCSVHPKRKN